jgi:hypothetical protein
VRRVPRRHPFRLRGRTDPVLPVAHQRPPSSAPWAGPTSRTLSMNCGSGDSLNSSTECDFSPKAPQIRRDRTCAASPPNRPAGEGSAPTATAAERPPPAMPSPTRSDIPARERAQRSPRPTGSSRSPAHHSPTASLPAIRPDRPTAPSPAAPAVRAQQGAGGVNRRTSHRGQR